MGDSVDSQRTATRSLAGGEEMDALMRSIDWSKTAIGPVETWSETLRMMLRLVLSNQLQMFLWWGPQFIQIHNGAGWPAPGPTHPLSIGQPASECWAEVWHILRPLIERPFRGGPSTWTEDLFLRMNRKGFMEETHWTIACSPVLDETAQGGIGGVIGVVNEITAQIVGERRVLLLRDLGACSSAPKTAEDACAIVAETITRHSEDVPFALIYLIDEERHNARLAGAAGIAIGMADSPCKVELVDGIDSSGPWPLAAAFRSGNIEIVADLGFRLQVVPPGPWPDPPRMAAVCVIPSNASHRLAGLLVLGVSSHLVFDDGYRVFFGLVASQVATTIANARAYEEERKRDEALAAILQTQNELAAELSATTRLHDLSTQLMGLGEIESVVENVLDATMKLQAADSGIVQLYDREAGTLRIVAARGFGKRFLDHFASVRDEGAVYGRTLHERARVIIEDVFADRDFEPHREMARTAGFGALQLTPIVNRADQSVGIISTYFRHPHRPSDRELRLTDLFARLAAEMLERKRAEEELRRVQADLARVARTMTMGELSASIAHEMNQPLAAIKVHARACRRWLEKSPPDMHEAHLALEHICSDVLRAADIIGGIKRVLRGGKAHGVPLDVDAVIREVASTMEVEVRSRQITLHIESSPTLPLVVADRVQLEQVVLNLMVNAVEAMDTVSQHLRTLVVRSERIDDEVAISICDSGIGLDPANRNRIFDAFYSTKQSGMGMGLAICQSIVEAHGGRISAAANDGPGETFRFTLPLRGLS